MLAVLSMVMMSGGLVLMTAPAATATGNENSGGDKVFVCKYVGKPGDDERLQTGNNPISVSVSSIGDYHGVGSYFNDAQGRSYVLAQDNRTGGGQEGEPSVDSCPKPEGPPEVTSVTPSYPSVTAPTCSAAGTLVVPAQPTGVVVSGGGANGAGPGTYVFTYAPAQGYVFPQGTKTDATVTVLPQKTGEACVTTKTVTPLYPSVTAPTCSAAGTLVVPAQPTGVVVSGGGANGAGPGTYVFTYAPAAHYVFPAGSELSKSVTVADKLTGAACGTVQSLVVTPSLPSQTEPTCLAAGSITEPAAQSGVNVVKTVLGDGAVKFDLTPAVGYTFAGVEQSVSKTVQAQPKLTGAACGEVEGTDESTPTPGGKPAVKPVAGPTGEVEGTDASRTPSIKGVGTVKGTAEVLGESASLPTSVDAGLAGAPQTDIRVLVGQGLLGGGLLLFVATTWSGLGRRRSGARQV